MKTATKKISLLLVAAFVAIAFFFALVARNKKPLQEMKRPLLQEFIQLLLTE